MSSWAATTTEDTHDQDQKLCGYHRIGGDPEDTFPVVPSMVMRKLMIAAGVVICAVKGLRWVFIGIPAYKRASPQRQFGRIGFKDPALEYIWEEQKTRPRGGAAHHLTDLIVEWNRLDAQRGAKLLTALAVLTFALGVGVGWLL